MNNLALHGTHGDALRKVLLEDQEDEKNRYGAERGTRHNETVIRCILGLQRGNAEGDGNDLSALQHNELHEIVIPSIDKGEDRQGTDPGLHNRENDGTEGSKFT